MERENTQKTIKKDVDSAEYAMFLYALGEYDRAEKHFLEALNSAPKSPLNNHNYATFLYETGRDYSKAERYYVEALRLDPTSAVKNYNYALLLNDIKNDYTSAEKYLKEALRLDPHYAQACCAYAMLLDLVRKDYDEAERRYKKSIELDPQDVRCIGNYAFFLKNVRKDYAKAQKYYKKALDLDPVSVHDNCGYAGLLFIVGRGLEGEAYLDGALSLVKEAPDELAVELWFYVLAHFVERRDEAVQELDRLLANGARSKGCDFEPNIKIAEKDGYPDMDELREYARKITTD